jgi:hypothetical protein
MMMAGDHRHPLKLHSVRTNQPDMKEAPAQRLRTGASRLGSLWRGTTSTPLSYYDVAATLMGIQGTTASILIGVISVPLSTVCEAPFTATR